MLIFSGRHLVTLWALCVCTLHIQSTVGDFDTFFSGESKRAADTSADQVCPVQRRDVKRCAFRHVDLDEDGKLSTLEVEYIRQHVLHWYELVLSWAINETTQKIMSRCAETPDLKYITDASFNARNDSCLAHCVDLKLADSMCDRMRGTRSRQRAEMRTAYKNWLTTPAAHAVAHN